jgi:hypothetical protein
MGFQEARVRRHHVAGLQEQHVARHHLGGGDEHRSPVAPDAGARRAHRAEREERSLGAVLLEEADHRVQDHDRRDGDGVRALAQDDGDAAGSEEEPDHRPLELLGDENPGRGPFLAGQLVGPVLRQASGGFGGGEACHGRGPIDRAALSACRG